jgi:dynein heavy chain
MNDVVEMIKRIHKTVESKSKHYKEALRRFNYVTPKSFLEQLDSFKSIIKEKLEKSKFDVNRLKNGLDKLNMANEEVGKMEIELTAKAPLLEVASKETEEMMIIITADKKVADEQQVIVAAEEIIATKQANEAKEIERVANDGVKEANEILATALKEVALLQDSHIVEVKSVNNPAMPVRIILGGLVIMNEDLIKKNGGAVIMVASDDPKAMGKKVPDYFATAKMYLLNNPKKLLEILQKYDRDNIP